MKLFERKLASIWRTTTPSHGWKICSFPIIVYSVKIIQSRFSPRNSIFSLSRLFLYPINVAPGLDRIRPEFSHHKLRKEFASFMKHAMTLAEDSKLVYSSKPNHNGLSQNKPNRNLDCNNKPSNYENKSSFSSKRYANQLLICLGGPNNNTLSSLSTRL